MVMMEPSQLKAEIVHYSALSAGPNQGLPRNAAQTIPDISSSEHLPPGHHASWLQSPGATLTDSRAGRNISYNHHIYTALSTYTPSYPHYLHTHHHIYSIYTVYTHTLLSLGCHWVSGARLVHISHHPAGTSDPTHPANGNQTITTITSLSWAQHSGTQSGECLHPSTGGEAAGVQHVWCLCSLPPTQVPGPGAGMTPAPASTSSSHLPNTGTGYTAPTTRHHSQLAHAAPCSMTPG